MEIITEKKIKQYTSIHIQVSPGLKTFNDYDTDVNSLLKCGWELYGDLKVTPINFRTNRATINGVILSREFVKYKE